MLFKALLEIKVVNDEAYYYLQKTPFLQHYIYSFNSGIHIYLGGIINNQGIIIQQIFI